MYKLNFDYRKTGNFFLKFIQLGLFLLLVQPQAYAFKLLSTVESYGGTGQFHGPGSYEAPQALFSMVLSTVAFTTPFDFLVPFYNNGDLTPNICAESQSTGIIDGKLSSGERINENINMCLATIAMTDMIIAAVDSGPLGGQQRLLFLEDGTLVVFMDLALDLGIGPSGVVKLPFYGTTGDVSVPYSLQTQLGIEGGKDQAGTYTSGSRLTGRLGDEDKDGWLDGTLVSVGNMPLSSPVFPGQPYAMVRHFELNTPVEGVILGDVKEIQNGK